MQLDSSIIYILTKELKKELIYGQVRKIHQINNRTMVLEIFKPSSSPAKLIISSYNPPLIYINDENKNLNYTPAQNFCMSLRKHLEGSKITDIKQINLDRVIQINFSRIETAGEIKVKNLYIKLIPSAPNIILTENNLILDACLKGNKKDRIISPKEKYILPGSQNRMDFTQFSKSELLDILTYNKNTSNALKELIFTLFNGFSELLLQEIFKNHSFMLTKESSTLNIKDIEFIVDVICNFKNTIKQVSAINLYNTSNQYLLSPLELNNSDKTPLKLSVNDAILYYLQNHKNNSNNISLSLQKEIHSLIKKEKRKLLKIEDELKETSKMNTYKLWGNLLAIHAYKKTPYEDFIILDNIFDAKQNKIKIPINKEKSLSSNSQLYFKKYNKMKTRIQIGKEKVENCKENIDALNHIYYYSTLITSNEELYALSKELETLGIKAKKNIEKKLFKNKTLNHNFLQFCIDGFKIFIGKNSKENEILTFKKSSSEDIWLHVKQIPGSHVIIKTEKQIVPIETLEKVASVAAFYSSGKDSGKITVDYTFIKNVKRIPNTKAGRVSYTNEKSILVIPHSPDFFIGKKT